MFYKIKVRARLLLSLFYFLEHLLEQLWTQTLKILMFEGQAAIQSSREPGQFPPPPPLLLVPFFRVLDVIFWNGKVDLFYKDLL